MHYRVILKQIYSTLQSKKMENKIISLSKNKIKYIRSLKDKKNRLESGVFVAEGVKLVLDLINNNMPCRFVATLSEVVETYPELKSFELHIASSEELQRASVLKTASSIIGVFYMPKIDIEKTNFDNNLTLVLDDIQDPGNLGTILRIADWFGIEDVVCSENTVDVYNSKTVQATMGAIARVKTHYTNLVSFLKSHSHLPVYGTFLEGNNIYTQPNLSNHGFIVMGNEGNGISPEVSNLVREKLFIPSFPPNRESTSESLNAAVATAIICSEFRRRE